MQQIENDWVTHAGLRALVVYHTSTEHRCGYVAIPKGHPLDQIHYSDPCPALQPIDGETSTGKRSPITLLLAAMSLADDDLEEDRTMPQNVFDVHGSITYSGHLPFKLAQSYSWWYGFDCAHAGDKTKYWTQGEERSLEYVAEQCEWLAEQIVAHPYKR